MSSSPYDDSNELYDRLTWGGVAIVALLGLLVVRAFYLQIVEGQTYRELAEANRVREVTVLPQRGLIFDRSGALLVNNVPGFTVYLVPADIPRPMDDVLMRLGGILDMPGDEIRARVDEGGGWDSTTPIPVKNRLSLEQVAIVESHRFELPGVRIEVEAERNYPKGEWAAHLLGYVSEVSAAQRSTDEFANLPFGMHVGQSGVELAFDQSLRGVPGKKGIEVNALGHERRIVSRSPPVQGDDLYLTIDAETQEAAESALSDQHGVVVALDPTNGEVIAMVSKPDFDPNMLSGSLTVEQWNRLVNDPDHPLNNRAIQGQYPPGSTFKIVVAAAALARRVVGPSTMTTCEGGLFFGNRTFRDWKAGGHGLVDIHRALAESCDVYFYEVGDKLGVDAIAEFANAFGLGRLTGIPLASEKQGLIPSTEWKRKARGEPWYPGETLSVAIGQGFVTATPLQLATMVATVSTGGERFRPRYVRTVRHRDGTSTESEPVSEPGPSLSAKHFAILREGLRGVVYDEHGTGKAARSEVAVIGGKTGTAQVVSLARSSGSTHRKYQDHAWFVAVAPLDHPQIAVAVLVEHGGHGGSAAAPIAKRVIEAYLGEPASGDEPAVAGSSAGNERGTGEPG